MSDEQHLTNSTIYDVDNYAIHVMFLTPLDQQEFQTPDMEPYELARLSPHPAAIDNENMTVDVIAG